MGKTYKKVFGGLAIMTTCVAVDPLALRPRLSPSLLLSLQFCNVQKNKKSELGIHPVRQK